MRATPFIKTLLVVLFWLSLAHAQSAQQEGYQPEERARAEQRESKGLEAQIRSADAAEWQAWISGASLLLTLAATVAILLSLNISRKAIQAASRANELSQQALVSTDRAWLEIKPSPLEPISWQEDTLRFCVNVNVKNVGRSPAIRVRVDIYPKFIPAIETYQLENYLRPLIEKRAPDEQRVFDRVIYPDGHFDGYFGFNHPKTFVERAAGKTNRFSIILYIVVEYWLPGDAATPRYTAAPFALGRVDQNGLDYPSKEFVPLAAATVKPWFEPPYIS